MVVDGILAVDYNGNLLGIKFLSLAFFHCLVQIIQNQESLGSCIHQKKCENIYILDLCVPKISKIIWIDIILLKKKK